MVTILAFDPGLGNLGWTCLKLEDVDKMKYIDSGIKKQKSKIDIQDKLLSSYRFIHSKVIDLKPNFIAYERMFFRGRSDSAASTIKVIGYIQLIAALYDTETLDVSPPTLKKFITGDGRADKEKMKEHTISKLLEMLSKNYESFQDADMSAVTKLVGLPKSYNHEIDSMAVALWSIDQLEKRS